MTCCPRRLLRTDLLVLSGFWACSLLLGCGLAREAKGAAEAAMPIERRMAKTTDLLRKAREREQEFLEAKPGLYALAALEVEKAKLCLKNWWPGAYRDKAVSAALDGAEGLLEALLNGADPGLAKHGRLERAYIAPNDGSPQPYVLYVPKSYDGAKPFGLLVYLHGYAPDLDKENWVSGMYAQVLEDYARRCECIMLMPFARSNTDFQGVGEDDVMCTTDKVMGQYNIDPERVIMSGYSMGGMGAWTIAAHYPHRFAAVLAISSRSDFYMWKRIEPEEVPGFKRKLITQEFGAEMLANYRHLPAFLVHGSDDWGISVHQSRTMYSRLRDKDYDPRYMELADKGHLFFYSEDGAREELVEWLRARRLVSAPRTIRYRTTSLKYGRAYWVEILAIGDWGRPADLTCELSEDGASLNLTTDNVLRLRIAPPAELVGDPAALAIQWNGARAAFVVDKMGRLVLGERPPAGALEKTAALCGPVREAFAGPFTMVYGGPAGGITHRRALRAADDWKRFAKGVPAIVAAADVTDEMLKGRNLILFGTPADNPWIARIAPALPIKIEDGTYRVGGKSYDSTKFGLWLIYPNLWARGHCVVINSGPVWGSRLPENHKLDFIPDFIVYSSEKSQDGTECNRFVCAGFFDQYWRLSPQSTWYSEQPR